MRYDIDFWADFRRDHMNLKEVYAEIRVLRKQLADKEALADAMYNALEEEGDAIQLDLALEAINA